MDAKARAPAACPTQNTPWTAPGDAVLTPTTPVTLTYDNGQGLSFARTISIDQQYMFTVTDRVTNTGPQPVSIAPMGLVTQMGTPADFLTVGGKAHQTSTLVHEGGIGVIDGKLQNPSYTCVFGQLFCNAWKKDQPIVATSSSAWLGITQKYWLAALMPDQGVPTSTSFSAQSTAGPDAYSAAFIGPLRSIAAGASVDRDDALLRRPQDRAAVAGLPEDLRHPAFRPGRGLGRLLVLHAADLRGCWSSSTAISATSASAILALTVVIRLALFPLANKSYESMSKMQKIQPQVDELRKKFEDDQAKIQQETMALYQREKINPLMGCLPLLIQIPIFYSLYKMLSVTIEMRQAPFFGWIHDLSARDPTTIWNLFGLIPWNPAMAPLHRRPRSTGRCTSALWPMIYGFTMWLSTSR